MVRKMKAIYHTLNLFNMDVTKKCLIGECWVPVHDVPFIRQTLADGGVSKKYDFVNVNWAEDGRRVNASPNKRPAACGRFSNKQELWKG